MKRHPLTWRKYFPTIYQKIIHCYLQCDTNKYNEQFTNCIKISKIKSVENLYLRCIIRKIHAIHLIILILIRLTKL